MEYDFSLKLLQAISDWQRSSTPARANKLKAECASLPIEFRSCKLVCFRQVALVKGDIWALIAKGLLSEKVSSWTLDIEVAKGFKGGVPPQGSEYTGTILFTRPTATNVIVNIQALYLDPGFVAALELHKKEINGFHDGAGRWVNSQSEVVLEVPTVTQEDVYSMGGYSSHMDKLVEVAATERLGRAPSDAEREDYLLAAADAGVAAGPKWLSHEGLKNVLERTKPKAEVLVEMKRLRDKAKASLVD